MRLDSIEDRMQNIIIILESQMSLTIVTTRCNYRMRAHRSLFQHAGVYKIIKVIMSLAGAVIRTTGKNNSGYLKYNRVELYSKFQIYPNLVQFASELVWTLYSRYFFYV